MSAKLGSHGARIPSLDGLRAISIALVLVLHMSGTKNFLAYGQIEWFNPGDLGVRTFFIISGFLITSLLLEELDAAGRISLGNFYIRRTFRIFPAFYAYVLVVALLGFLGLVTLAPGDLLHAVTYTVNYHNTGGSWFVAHLWSLSVEEQFYLLWPATLAFLGRRRGLLAAAAVVAIVPLIRLVGWIFFPGYRDDILHTFETVADSLATGCLLAGSRDWLIEQSWYRNMQASRWFAVIPVIIVLADTMFIRPRIYFTFMIPILNVSIALMIDWCVRHSTGIIGRILNARPMVFVGTLSYSLYLWQQLFCQQQRHPGTWWGMFPSNLILSFLTALASFYLIEQPFLNLRKRFSKGREGRALAAAHKVK